MALMEHKTDSPIQCLGDTIQVDTSDVQEAMKMLNAFLETERASVASIVLQAQKRGQEKSPNPLNLLAPRVGLEPTT